MADGIDADCAYQEAAADALLGREGPAGFLFGWGVRGPWLWPGTGGWPGWPGTGRAGGGEGFGAVDEGAGQVGQAAVAGPGAVAEQREGLVHVHPEPLGELALGLLDDDPAVQRRLQLLVQDVAVPHPALVQQADRGHVGQRLADPDAGRGQRARIGAEQVQR